MLYFCMFWFFSFAEKHCSEISTSLLAFLVFVVLGNQLNAIINQMKTLILNQIDERIPGRRSTFDLAYYQFSFVFENPPGLTNKGKIVCSHQR